MSRPSYATMAIDPPGWIAMALAASTCGGSSTGPRIGGGGAKPRTNSPAGRRQTVTPKPTTAVSKLDPSGVDASAAIGLGKVTTQRGRRPSPGALTGTQPSGGTPAAPGTSEPKGRTKCTSIG